MAGLVSASTLSRDTIFTTLSLSEDEACSELEQWGPYFTSLLLLIAELVTKWKVWDFSGKDCSGFKWLLNGDEWGKANGKDEQ